MPQIKSTTVEHTITTQTVQGEVTLNINLTLNITTDKNGELQVTAAPVVKPEIKKETLDYVPLIPDFDVGELIDFGQDIETK
jgi:hypothetical protein